MSKSCPLVNPYTTFVSPIFFPQKDFKKELKSTVKENELLRHSLSKAKEDADLSRTELHFAEDDKGTLLKKLVEAEMDGKAAAEHVVKLRDAVRKLKQVE